MNSHSLFETLLNMPYDDITVSCQSNPATESICQDPAFWEAKARRDFNQSLPRDTTGQLSPRERYLMLFQEKPNLSYEECIRQAIINGEDPTKCPYQQQYHQREEIPRLIAAAKDEASFRRLLYESGIHLYSLDTETLYSILLEAITGRNYTLIQELANHLSTLIQDEPRKDALMDTAATFLNYDYIEWLDGLFPVGTAEKWLLQSAVLNEDRPQINQLTATLWQLDDYGFTEAADAFTRAGDMKGLQGMIEIGARRKNLPLGRLVLETAARKGRLSAIKLLFENNYYRSYLRKEWIKRAYDISSEKKEDETMKYLEKYL